jgi:hypothetical protein
MTDAPFSSADYAPTASDRPLASGAAAPQPFHLTPDMINGLVVIGGSLVMALAGISLGVWLQLPFGN